MGGLRLGLLFAFPFCWLLAAAAEGAAAVRPLD